jgi:hypothetical protein
MESELIKAVILNNSEVLITQIEEIGSELGEPDCKLIKPFLVKYQKLETIPPTLEPWLNDVTTQDTFMIHSDKILTITEPRPTLIEKYTELTK